MLEVLAVLLVSFLALTKASRWSLLVAMVLGVLFSLSGADPVHLLVPISSVILGIIGLDVGTSLIGQSTSWRTVVKGLSATFASLITLTAVSWLMFWTRPSLIGLVLACASTSVVTGPALLRLQGAQAVELYTLVLKVAATDDFFSFGLFSFYLWQSTGISIGVVSVLFIVIISMVVSFWFSGNSSTIRGFRAVIAGTSVVVGFMFAQPLLSSVAAGFLIKGETIFREILVKLARAAAPAYFFLTFTKLGPEIANNLGSLFAQVGIVLLLLLVSRVAAALVVGAGSGVLFAVATYPRGVVALAIANTCYASHLFSASLYSTFLAAVFVSNAIVVAIFQPLYAYTTRAIR